VTVSGSLRSATPIAAVALLAACAQAPPAPDAPAPRVFTKLVDTPREDAVRRHREYAAASRAANDPATALDHLQVAAMLEPDNAAVRRDIASVQEQIRIQAREHLEAGRAAQRSNDLSRASSEFLRVLAVDPRNAEAARALRDIDRQNMARAQAGRAARVRVEDLFAEARAAWAAPAPAAGSAPPAAAAPRSATAAPAAAAADPREGYDLDMRIEMMRAGDTTSALRELKAWVDAHPRDRAARQRIGAAVAERAKDAESRGQRAQALTLYEQALALRGEPMAEWTSRIAALKKAASDEYYNEGVKLMRTDLPAAIGKFEAALKVDPQHTNAALRLREAKTMQDRLSRVPAK